MNDAHERMSVSLRLSVIAQEIDKRLRADPLKPYNAIRNHGSTSVLSVRHRFSPPASRAVEKRDETAKLVSKVVNSNYVILSLEPEEKINI